MTVYTNLSQAKRIDFTFCKFLNFIKNYLSFIVVTAVNIISILVVVNIVFVHVTLKYKNVTVFTDEYFCYFPKLDPSALIISVLIPFIILWTIWYSECEPRDNIACGIGWQIKFYLSYLVILLRLRGTWLLVYLHAIIHTISMFYITRTSKFLTCNTDESGRTTR